MVLEKKKIAIVNVNVEIEMSVEIANEMNVMAMNETIVMSMTETIVMAMIAMTEWIVMTEMREDHGVKSVETEL